MTTKIKLGRNQEAAAQLRWVRRLTEPEQCQGFLARTPLKAIFEMGGRPPIGLDNYRCKVPALWHFTALKRSYAKDGTYCWQHLVYRCLYADEAEIARTDKALARIQKKLDKAAA